MTLHQRVFRQSISPVKKTGIKKKQNGRNNTHKRISSQTSEKIHDGLRLRVYKEYPNLPMYDSEHSVIDKSLKKLFNSIVKRVDPIDMSAKLISAMIYIITGVKIEPKLFCGKKNFNVIENGLLWTARKVFTVVFPELVIIEEVFLQIEKIIKISKEVKEYLKKVINAIVTKKNVEEVLASVDCSIFAGKIRPYRIEGEDEEPPITGDTKSKIPLGEDVDKSGKTKIDIGNDIAGGGILPGQREEENPILGVGELTLPQVTHEEAERILADLRELYNELDNPSEFHSQTINPKHDENIRNLQTFHSENEQTYV